MLGQTPSLRKLMVDSGAEQTAASHVTFAPDAHPEAVASTRPMSDDSIPPQKLGVHRCYRVY